MVEFDALGCWKRNEKKYVPCKSFLSTITNKSYIKKTLYSISENAYNAGEI
jgi:hypothetical protein